MQSKLIYNLKKGGEMMARQTPLQHIRRCRNCGHKTHQRFWKNEQCPVCGSVCGYHLSTHGGLTEAEIQEARNKIFSSDPGQCQKHRLSALSLQTPKTTEPYPSVP